MPRIALRAGAYQARSLIANAQRSVNLYAEVNPEETDPDAPVAHYPRPGLVALNAAPINGRGRGVYRASNGSLFACIEDSVYYIDPGFVWTLLGKIAAGGSPVSFADNGASNGNDVVVVDGTAVGYTFTLNPPGGFGVIVDATGLFVGADKVQYFDTFFTFNQPGTNNWYCSLSESVSFNALDIAAKGTYPDPIQSIIACQRIMWLVGAQSAEPWFNAGDPIFPFEEMPGQFVPHGTIAKYSIATTDVNAFWLSQDADGRAVVLMTEGYGAKRISTHALETLWLAYPQRADAIGYTYQQGGHSFYVLHFPAADATWAYDLATKQWHQRAWMDNNGVLHRERIAFHAFAYDTNVGQDWQTGALFALSQDATTDNGQPIVCIRSFPHAVAELKRVTIPYFMADIETGSAPDGTPSPTISLRVSKDGGSTFGNARQKDMISTGHYRSAMRWRSLGQGRDWVFELSWSAAMKTALQGAYIGDPIIHDS